MIQQKIATARKLWHTWHRDSATQRFIAYNERQWGGWKAGGPGEVLCNLDPTCLTHIKFSYLMNVLAQQYGAQIKTFSTRPAVTQRRFSSVYQSFNVHGYIDVRPYPADHPQVQAVLAEIGPQITTKQALFDARILGVWIGVDIYETYLRKCEQPTVNFHDPRLWQLVAQTIGLILFWQEYFASHAVRAVGMSIDGYTANNTVTKVAQAAGVPVYTPDLLAPRIRDVPFAAAVAYPHYPQLFAGLPPAEQTRGLTQAQQQLARRLRGEVGVNVNMAYSTKSAWHRNFGHDRVVQESARTKVLICSHDFVDAPHSHGGMLFTDFVEWLLFVAKTAHETNYDWYIKLHADHEPTSAEIVQTLAAEFPRLTIVPAGTSHYQLVQEGIDVVLTCYGSVGHEYPLLGIPVLNAGYNPHIAYSFNYHAHSLGEYQEYLHRLPSLTCSVKPRDIYEFYYLYHYDELANTALPWWQELVATVDSDTKAAPAVYDIWQEILSDSRHRDVIASVQRAVPRRVHHVAELAKG